MADTKITALTALTAADPANDVIPIVDVSDTTMAASGTTKKISVNNILGASGTATLASATITGDLTVDTNVLKVDTTNNFVGIGTASPAVSLDIRGASAAATLEVLRLQNTGGGANTKTRLNFYAASTNYASITGGFGASAPELIFDINTSTGQFIWNNLGSEAMRLNSSGNVGIGVTPSAWGSGLKGLQIGSLGGASILGYSNSCELGSNFYYDTGGYKYGATAATSLIQFASGEFRFKSAGSGTAGNAITLTQAMTLDASGNLLIGTTSNTSFSSRIALSYNSGVTNWAVGPSVGTPTGFFISANVGAQGVYLANATATSWTAWSDERLKDIIEPINNAVFKVGSLRAVIGKFKNDTTNTRKPFLIAQDVLAVLPEAVDVSNPDSFGVSYTDVIPLLVAAIKELTAEVNALKNA